MPEPVNWQNPYQQRDGQWLRGNLHAHSTSGSHCSAVPLPRLLDLYATAGYDFLSVSDHMSLTAVADPRLTLIPGIEWNSPDGEHVGVYGFDVELISRMCTEWSQPAMLATMAPTGALLVMNHPNWTLRPHYHREELEAAQGYQGIEIYNGVIKRMDGSEYATDKWDYLLSRGRRVLGFASDDTHVEGDVARGWIMTRCRSRRPHDILQALCSGNFYCSNGVTITDIRRDGNQITIESADAQEIQFVGTMGRVIESVRDHSFSVDLTGHIQDYVRFTLFGQGSEMAWTQPFFLE